MYHKAMAMGDTPSAERVLDARSPQEAKNIGRTVSNWDEAKWCREREGIMFNGLWLKTNQHEDVKRLLLGTTGKLLAEASPYDKVWGIGLSKDDERAGDRDKWKGSNLLGKAWIRVRELLLLLE